jgi:hypothetical protein
MKKLEFRCAARYAVFAASAALLAACGKSSTDATRSPANITIVTGSGQSGFTGLTLSQPLVVQVTAADGTPVAGQIVDFTVASGQATLNPTSATTDANGKAQTQVTLGSSAGPVEVAATVRATSLSAKFTATAQTITSNVTCSSSNTLTLAVGETRTSLAGNGVCLTSTAASEYMVNGFFASSVPSAQTQVGVTGFGITTPAGSPAGSVPALGASGGGVLRLTAKGGGVLATLDPQRQLDLRLRQLERTVLAPRMVGARAAIRRRGALLAAAPPNVGDILQLNVDLNCNSSPPRYRSGRVAAITNTAIIVADTGNPAGGFTDADYQSVGVTFDTLVDPLDQAAFGAPTDIDGNGRIILFYTRAVNEMTPALSPGGIVEGFFHPRDLFPRTALDPSNACTGSNFAEMFYLIVPDTGGAVNGNKRTKAFVQQLTIAVTAHEYQHLINAARRIYFNNADAFEEVWLNEGLSHMAEELLYYHAAGLAPRQNIDGTSIRTTQQRRDAFNQYQSGNFGRYESFLDAPMTSSPYADNDSLATRGATWGFLRYAADHQGTSDGTVWQQLVNSTTTGLQNLTNVFGANILNQIRDWSISVYTDDQAATTAAYQQPSWNLRSIYLSAFQAPAPFPLVVFPLANGAQTTQTLSGGGSLYTRLGVPANVTAAVGWSVSSPSVQISIVRTR